MNLLGVAELVLPAWEPDQGWRVLTPDGQQVSAANHGGRPDRTLHQRTHRHLAFYDLVRHFDQVLVT